MRIAIFLAILVLSLLSIPISYIVDPLTIRYASPGSTISIDTKTLASLTEKPTSEFFSRLNIPSIHVSVPVVPVGLTTAGALDVPKNFAHAGWYRLGARPGEIGTAVIDGHFGYLKGKPAVFNNLYKLRAWDRLSVDDGKGNLVFFIVRGTKIYGLNDTVPEVFHRDDGKAHLNIITCHGKWNPVSKSYPDRLVVFTDKEK